MAHFTLSNPDPKSLIAIFFPNRGYYSIAKYQASKLAYYPQSGDLTPELIMQHLNGELTLAISALGDDGTVKWMAFDFDGSIDQCTKNAQKLQGFLRDRGIPSYLEFSGKKGYHVWIFLEKSLESYLAIAWMQSILKLLHFPTKVEHYPKQAWVPGRKGNVIKMPFGYHPITHARCNFGEFDSAGKFIPWEEWDWEFCPTEKLQINLDNSIVDLIVDLIAPHWVEGIRHDFALALSGFLLKTGWTSVQIFELIQRICARTNDTEIENRLGCVKDTIENYNRGDQIVGYSMLADLLPALKLKDLVVLAFDALPLQHIQLIDRIRIDRIPAFLKLRRSVQIIYSYLKDNGNLFRNAENDLCYWMTPDNYIVNTEDSWFRYFLYKEFGIGNDEFGKQVYRDLDILIRNESEKKSIYLLSHWDVKAQKLYVNPAGNKVFILDGDTIQESYNGKEVFFHTRIMQEIHWDWIPQNVWEFLTSDLSFQSSQIALAEPEEQEQLLRCWILSLFFPELMRTKPILTIMGAPGSGKTTAIRRILKLVEHPDADVLEFVWDKPDALRSSLASHKILTLDNLEGTRSHWLANILDSIATGSTIELRKLYHTNETYVIRPNCFVAITAVSLDNMNDAFYDRILPIDLTRINHPKPEYIIQQAIQQNWVNLWCDLLDKLNQVVRCIRENSEPETVPLRMADFSRLVGAIEGISPEVVQQDLAQSGLRKLEKRQSRKLSEQSPLFLILSDWVKRFPQRASEWTSPTALYQELMSFARIRKYPWNWKTVVAFSNHFRSIEQDLEATIGVQLKMDRDGNGRLRTFYRFGKNFNTEESENERISV